MFQVYFHRLTNGVAATTIISNQTLTTGTWYHFAYTYNGSTGAMTGYLNASSVGTNTQTGSGITDVTSALDIGGDGVLTWVSGLEDEVVISSNIWSATDVSDIYNRTNPPVGCPAPPPPVAQGNLWQIRSFEGKGFITTTSPKKTTLTYLKIPL